jgi:RNA polymerase sigma factor (sigma-70 family)
MAVRPLTHVLRYVRQVACCGAAAWSTDGQLLERYIADGSETAFAALVERHGPMVHAVCRRVLGNSHDADDAFQAAFLVLVRKAARIVNRESVGSWLHGVAYRAALKAKAAAIRRRTMEKQAPAVSATEDMAEAVWRELRPILDEEIDRLPEKYRLPFVLCYLEGKTNVAAAQQLSWPLGTVATRLARARERLRKRLSHRGAELAAGLLVAIESRTALSASTATRTALDRQGSEQVQALAKGVLRNMWMTKMRSVVAALLVIVAIAGGIGVLLYRASAANASGEKEGKSRPSALLPARPDSQTAKGSQKHDSADAANSLREFHIDCKITEIRKDGVHHTLAQPQFKTMEGNKAAFIVGQTVAGPGPEAGTIDFLPAGLQLDVTVYAWKDGRLRLDIGVQDTQPVCDGQECAYIVGQTGRCVKVVNAGETVQFIFSKGNSGDKLWAALTVREAKMKTTPQAK